MPTWANCILLVCVAFGCLQGTAGVLCKICQDGYGDLAYCNKIGKCVNGSICYTDVFINNVGQKVIYTGCRSIEECRNNGFIQKRQFGNQICGACCNSDFCNAEACGVKPPTGFKECYGCDSVDNIEDCETSVLCPSTEDCMTEYRYAGGGKAAYRLGCNNKVQCNIRDEFIKNFSRRALPDPDSANSFHVENNQPMESQLREIETRAAKRAIDDPNAICLSCCDYQFCNAKENCHYRQEAPPPRTTQIIP